MLFFFSASYLAYAQEIKYVDEMVEDLVAYRSYADGFDNLTQREKLFAFYMTNAAIAGRDIFFDQMHRDALAIRNILGNILTYNNGIDSEIYKKIKRYAYIFWNFGCNYNTGTDYSKIMPTFSTKDLQTAAGIANKNGAKINLDELKSYDNVIFDPEYEPFLLVNNNVEKSAVNFYLGNITSDEVINFYKNYTGPVHRDEAGNVLGEIGLNSKLTKTYTNIFRNTQKVVEQFPQELYGKEIHNIIHFLSNASEYASPQQKTYLAHLRRYYTTGDVYNWHLFNKDWLSDNPNVDFMVGFVEVYEDPMGKKGSYEGIVNYINVEETKKQTLIAQNVQYYEDNAPWADIYKKKWTNTPVAKSINIITETGSAQSCCISGINLPNEQYLRDNYGSKIVQIVNTGTALDEGSNQVAGTYALEEFALPDEIEPSLKYGNQAYDVLVYFHEITGHGGGQMAPGKEGVSPDAAIGGYYNTLEEGRADLTALWNMLDPKTAELGILSREAAEAEYKNFVRGTLTMLRNYPNADRIVEAHRATENMIVRWIIDNTDAIEQKEINGKTFFVVNSIDKMRQAVGKLLAEIQRIKSEVDPDAAKNLVEKYGQYLDLKLRDEVVQRYKVLEEKYSLPRYRVMIHPRIYIDSESVKTDHTESFLTQQLRYDNFNNYVY